MRARFPGVPAAGDALRGAVCCAGRGGAFALRARSAARPPGPCVPLAVAVRFRHGRYRLDKSSGLPSRILVCARRVVPESARRDARHTAKRIDALAARGRRLFAAWVLFRQLGDEVDGRRTGAAPAPVHLRAQTCVRRPQSSQTPDQLPNRACFGNSGAPAFAVTIPSHRLLQCQCRPSRTCGTICIHLRRWRLVRGWFVGGCMLAMRQYGAPLTAVILSILGIYLAIDNWCWLTGNGTESPSATVRNAALAIAAPVTLLLAVWRSYVAHRQAEIAQRSLHDERYRTAVGMLEVEQLFVRLGAIDTLVQLARSYPADFHLRVARLLAAFVRHPLSDPDGQVQGRAREEVQTIMIFYGERSQEARRIEDREDFIIDLRGSDLSWIWLGRGTTLARVRLINCTLSGAVLDGVKGLTQNHLRGARAAPTEPPSLRDTLDCDTGQLLAWPPTAPA